MASTPASTTRFPNPSAHSSNNLPKQASATPIFRAQMEPDQLEILRRSPRGDVPAGEIALDGHPVPVIVKRPRQKHLRRYIQQPFRGSRAAQAWTKGWRLVVRDIPTAWPILI